MSLTAFPHGISSFGIPQLGGGSEIPITTGTYFFVDDSGSNSYDGLDADHPFADLDYAVGRCTAGVSDVILVMPGHAETISSAGAITADVADITIHGLGRGLSRPTITYDTANTTIINITGANTKFSNLIFSANYADIAMAIDVDAKGVMIDHCSFRDTAGSMNWDSCIGTDDTNNAADDLTVTNCDRLSIDSECLAFISILANITGLTIQGNVSQDASTANIGHFLIMGTFVVLKAIITNNVYVCTGANTSQTVGIFATGSSTTSTGYMAHNFAGSLEEAADIFDTATLDFHHFENYYTGAIAASGYLLPGKDS